MIGWLAPLFKVSALATFPLFANVQALVLLVSWNLSCPIVRGVSRLTVMPDVMSTVEKSANARLRRQSCHRSNYWVCSTATDRWLKSKHRWRHWFSPPAPQQQALRVQPSARIVVTESSEKPHGEIS